MSKLAIHLGHQREAANRQIMANRRRRPSKGLPLTATDRTKRKIQHLDTEFLFRSCMPYRYVQFLSRPLIEEVAAWEAGRNKHHAKADWQFTTAEARVKLKRLYPTL